MAIVQISQITNRLGLQSDLPQLAGGELGWSTDSRRLFIGNGTPGQPPLGQGAPVIGNTEILTEFSNISALLSNTSSQLSQGTFTRLNGQTVILLDNKISSTPIFTIDTTLTPTFSFDYSIARSQTYRTGTVRVASAGLATVAYTAWSDSSSFVQNASTGVTITVTQNLTTITVGYTTTSTGLTATLNYSVYYLA